MNQNVEKDVTKRKNRMLKIKQSKIDIKKIFYSFLAVLCAVLLILDIELLMRNWVLYLKVYVGLKLFSMCLGLYYIYKIKDLRTIHWYKLTLLSSLLFLAGGFCMISLFIAYFFNQNYQVFKAYKPAMVLDYELKKILKKVF